MLQPYSTYKMKHYQRSGKGFRRQIEIHQPYNSGTKTKGGENCNEDKAATRFLSRTLHHLSRLEGGTLSLQCTKITSNGVLEDSEGVDVNGDVPVEISTHVAFHRIDLVDGEKAPGNDMPGTVEV